MNGELRNPRETAGSLADQIMVCQQAPEHCLFNILFLHIKKIEVSTLCDPVDCSLPGSSIHGILQARILEWVAISFSRDSSLPKNPTGVSCIAGKFFTN